MHEQLVLLRPEPREKRHQERRPVAWQLDPQMRAAGRRGVQEAREALRKAADHSYPPGDHSRTGRSAA